MLKKIFYWIRKRKEEREAREYQRAYQQAKKEAWDQFFANGGKW